MNQFDHFISDLECTELLFLDYPWRSMMNSDVIKWLYLPDFHTQPNSMFLVCEFYLRNIQH